MDKDVKKDVNEKKVKMIKDTLKKNPYGLSITQINDKVDLARDTVIKYLMYLQGTGDVGYRKFGNSKVYILLK